MEPNELLSGMFISGVTADVAFYGGCARQQMPRRLKDRAISFNAKKKVNGQSVVQLTWIANDPVRTTICPLSSPPREHDHYAMLTFILFGENKSALCSTNKYLLLEAEDENKLVNN